MFCKNCGQPLNENQAICLNCGVKTSDGVNFCSNCGNPVQPGAEICMSCGFAVKNSKPLAGQDKLVMILICFFIGAFGVHNFMMGETKKGIVKIVATFLCGIGWILALIDLIKIATDKYEVDPEKWF